jgi:hypothetical protein
MAILLTLYQSKDGGVFVSPLELLASTLEYASLRGLLAAGVSSINGRKITSTGLTNIIQLALQATEDPDSTVVKSAWSLVGLIARERESHELFASFVPQLTGLLGNHAAAFEGRDSAADALSAFLRNEPWYLVGDELRSMEARRAHIEQTAEEVVRSTGEPTALRVACLKLVL